MVEFHYSGDQNVIEEVTKRCLPGIDIIDIDAEDVTSTREKLREPVSAENLITSFYSDVYYEEIDGEHKSIGDFEGKKREKVVSILESTCQNLILSQVEVSDGETQEIVSILLNDGEIGYVEVEEFWHGEGKRGLID